jgi:deazaflavin-dependent oxidoreductase (nitroreductase family)
VDAGAVVASFSSLLGMFEALFSGLLRVHQAIYEATDGWIGHRLLGVPTLLLRTTGRKTGQTRTAALVYAKDGESYIVVASKGGADVSPGWFFNAEANPEVEVQLGRTRRTATAEPIERGSQDYDRLWALTNQRNGNRYNQYQRKTARPIPLLRLTPTP